jgi:putative membrane protein
MRPNFPILMTAMALALVACSKKDDTTTADSNVIDMNMPMDNGAMDNTAAAPSPTTAQGFVNAAAASDKFEIESSKLAATAASSAAVKNFAQQMVTAHTGSTEKLKSTISGINPPVTPDDTLAPDQQATLDSLKGLQGTAFDSAYAAAQSEAHQKTLDTLKTYAASGDNDQLKAFANGLIPTVTAHLNLAKGLK